MTGAAGSGRRGSTGGKKRRSTPKVGQTQTIKSPGQRPISVKTGGLHASVGVPQGQKIPAAKLAAAARGEFGPKAQKQAQFAQNVLTGPRSGPVHHARREGPAVAAAAAGASV
jgi:hypothetical protein